MTEWYVIYKLRGRSHQAARDLNAFTSQYAQANPINWTKHSVAGMEAVTRQLQKEMFNQLTRVRPDLVRSTGLGHPVTQVWHGPDAAPRAYQSWPEIYSTGHSIPEYFMFCPIDYQGNHFVPDNGILLGHLESRAVHNRLFAGNWRSNSPLLSRPDQGVATPADFLPGKSRSFLRTAFSRQQSAFRVFKAHGASLDAIRDFNTRRAEKTKTVQLLYDHIATMLPKTVNLPGRANVAVNANLSLRPGPDGQVHLWVSLRENANNAPVLLPDGPGYAIQESLYNERRLLPDPDTEAGRAFEKMLLNPALTAPELKDYAALTYQPAPDALKKVFNPASAEPITPTIYEDNGICYLAYTIDRSDLSIPASAPQDAIPVSSALYIWLEQDRIDRERGLRPPPMPEEIEREISYLKKLDNNDPGRLSGPIPQP